MSKIDKQYFGEDDQDYPWPGWDNTLGDPPKIRFDDAPQVGSPYPIQLKSVLTNVSAAAQQEGADALREQLKSLSDKTILVHPAEKGEPNMLFAAQEVGYRGSRTLSPPHIQYNPQRWERYQVEGNGETAAVKTAIAPPEQLLLGALAGYRNLYESYVDHMQAASPATPEKERNKLHDDADRADALGYNHEYIASVVNASMKSIVPDFQERSLDHYDVSEPLPVDSHGNPVIKPGEEEALRIAMKFHQYDVDRQSHPKPDIVEGSCRAATLGDVLSGIQLEQRQIILEHMQTRILEAQPVQETTSGIDR